MLISSGLDYLCRLKKCTEGEDEDPSGCPSVSSFKGEVWSYKDQLQRDYPSFTQIRAQINKNRKSKLRYFDMLL